MVRISDARMSGTAYGTVVLHVAPEAAAGGPLSLVLDGDVVNLDVAKRSLNLEISEADLQSRRRAWQAAPSPVSGYSKLYCHHVMQADRGCDMDYLVGRRGAPVPRNYL